MTSKYFTIETDADGIALVTWDMKDKPMNVLSAELMDELDALIDQLVADAAIKGVVLTSGKEAFSAGADLTMLQHGAKQYADTHKSKGEEAANTFMFENARRGSLVFRKLETCGKPWAAAINGIALGGGFEITLACHYRVIADSPKAGVGLPEVKVGLFPGAGGTQRVPRLMSTQDALQMLFKGDTIKPAAAKAMNLVHEVAPPDEIVSRAKTWIKAGGSPVAPWDEKNFKLPSGKVFSPGGMMVWPAANALYRKETYDNYPAVKAILSCVFEGLQLPMDTALKVESRYFSNIMRSKEAAGMIRSLFLSKGELEKGARRPKDAPRSNIRKVGVLGAGFMGAGIAFVTAAAGVDVVLIDRDQAAADKGKAYSEKIMSDRVMKGRAKAAEKEALLAHITPSADYDALKDCDLIVEAVFEDRAVKAEATKKAQAVVGPDVVFASNTSTLPIGSLAEMALKAEDFVGIHFFSPVEKMMLVEIIKGAKTGDRAIATALDFVRLIRKTPIVVNDTRGFFANRCVGNYIGEGHRMLAEGVPPAMIENVARMAGMPVGPLSLNDEVALDLGWRIVEATKKDLGEQAVDPQQERILRAMVVEKGRFGRKNGKGFYDYPEKGKKRLWPGLADIAGTQLDPETIDVEELKQRFLVVQAVEAARTVAEGVVTDPREADVGSIFGFGFPPFTGGALSYIDFMGLPQFVALCDKLSKKYGDRFVPPRLVIDMAKNGETFYGKFGAQAKAA
jgi:3-hydroxyacyl-CoA dehydrogenase/enoyl-CoA hydratase/3-hydroxybutyryl-CoA epimerase